MITFKEWLTLIEMTGTSAIYDGTRGAFNWWGAKGSPGKNIEGYPIGTKEDKKEKKRGRRKKK